MSGLRLIADLDQRIANGREGSKAAIEPALSFFPFAFECRHPGSQGSFLLSTKPVSEHEAGCRRLSGSIFKEEVPAHSITKSALLSNVEGNSMPSDLAVFVLSASS
jgi:hypothetical protein